MPGRPPARGLAALLFVLPQTAGAHSALPGIEGFYLGLTHGIATPATLLATLATAVMAAQDWPRRFRLGWPLFAVCLALGLAGALVLDAELPLDAGLLGAAVLGGCFAALAAGRFTLAALPLLALSGLVLGAAGAPDDGARQDVAITMAGAFLGPNLALLLVGGALDLLREHLPGPAPDIALRVAASWLAAIALMLLALTARPMAA